MWQKSNLVKFLLFAQEAFTIIWSCLELFRWHLVCLSLWHIWNFLVKVAGARNFCKETCARYLKWHTCKLNNESCRLKSGVSWALLCCDSDWPITAHHLQKKTFRNRTRSSSESWLSQVKTCASAHATSKSFHSKVAFESDFQKKTFRCVIGFRPRSVQF